MHSDDQDDSIRLSRSLALPITQAFQLFTSGFGSWYPSVYTWSGVALVDIAIEEGPGGRCYEEGPHGFRCDWGRVLEWEPPRRLKFSWQISYGRTPVPDPAWSSEVEVSWSPREDGGTDVDFCHRRFRRHGEEWRNYLEAMGSEDGWPFILDCYLSKAAS